MVTECLYVRRPNRAPHGATSPETGTCMHARHHRSSTHVDARHGAAGDDARPPAAGPAGHRSSRRSAAGRHPRPTFLLAALVVGGVAAGMVGFHGTPSASAQPTSVLTAQEEALDTDDQGVEVLPQASITEAEAQQRLQQVAASRAARAEAQAAAEEAARPKCVLPVNGARLTSTFAMRWGVMHWGIDLAAPMRTPEYAAMDGVVLRAGPASGFGLAVYIKHANGDVTVYGHMDSILVDVGQYVQAGDTIALLGQRGQATGPHLHFEVHQGGMDGARVDPIPWLSACGVQV
jgi:murein DD-endopeptidase MepM/ murein hydrolase activator NlpD